MDCPMLVTGCPGQKRRFSFCQGGRRWFESRGPRWTWTYRTIHFERCYWQAPYCVELTTTAGEYAMHVLPLGQSLGIIPTRHHESHTPLSGFDVNTQFSRDPQLSFLGSHQAPRASVPAKVHVVSYSERPEALNSTHR